MSGKSNGITISWAKLILAAVMFVSAIFGGMLYFAADVGKVLQIVEQNSKAIETNSARINEIGNSVARVEGSLNTFISLSTGKGDVAANDVKAEDPKPETSLVQSSADEVMEQVIVDVVSCE